MSSSQNPFRNAQKNIETLWRLTNVDSYSDEEREALSFAVMAVQYAVVPERVEEFGEFLKSWPPQLTPEQEGQWDELDSGEPDDDLGRV